MYRGIFERIAMCPTYDVTWFRKSTGSIPY